MPYLDSSLPNPLFLIPPNGTLGSENTTLYFCIFKVLCPDTSSKTEFRVICKFYSFLFIFSYKNRSNRPKYFLIYYAHIWSNIAKDSGLIEITFTSYFLFSTCKYFCTFFNRVINLRFYSL